MLRQQKYTVNAFNSELPNVTFAICNDPWRGYLLQTPKSINKFIQFFKKPLHAESQLLMRLPHTLQVHENPESQMTQHQIIKMMTQKGFRKTGTHVWKDPKYMHTIEKGSDQCHPSFNRSGTAIYVASPQLAFE